MIQKVIMPKMGQTVEEAVIEKWHVNEGDKVDKGQVLFELTTDKATIEAESYYTGTMLRILRQEGETVPVNAVVAVVGDPGEEIPESIMNEAGSGTPAAGTPEGEGGPQPAPGSATPATAPAAPQPEPLPGPARPSGRVIASPRAKMRAGELGVNLAALAPTSPTGRITEKDVLAFYERTAAAKATPLARATAMSRGVDIGAVQGTGVAGKVTAADVAAARPAVAAGKVPLSAMRKIVAERMSASKREIPHFYLSLDADMTEAVAYRKQLNATAPVKVGFNDIIAKAVAQAMIEFPATNAAWVGDGIEQKDDINIGIAVALDEGLIVPVIRRADRLDIIDLARTSIGLIEKARSKRLLPDEYTGGSITISNLGMFDITSFQAVINPGEAAILAVGKIHDQPVVRDGGIHIRSMMNMTLSVDHRVIDGAVAAAFLKRVKDLLESPTGPAQP